MSATRRTDAALAVLVLAIAIVARLVVDVPFSLPWLLVGAGGTIGFEAVATRRAPAVRRYWDRRWVQVAVLVLALIAIGGGAIVRPEIVLSAVTGSLVTYLLGLGLVSVRDRRRSAGEDA